MKYFVKFLMLFALGAACNGDEIPEADMDTAYFPLRKGLFHVYTVNETRYSAVSEPEVSNYEIRTEVVDSFPSAQDQFTYVIHRSRRSGGGPWEPLDTWSARKNKVEVIVSEGNTSFVKIRFPVRAHTLWDGNALNALGEDEYAFKDIHQAMQLAGMTFEKTITVEQERNEDVIVFKDERREVYALDVGLVYKEVIQLHYCTDDLCLGQQKIDEGLELSISIKEYGQY